jgi:mannose-6-phosphate isomerase-like protein (cupin superfamily)
MADPGWQAFELEREIEERRRSGRPYREFLRKPTLSCGIYSLPAGSNDLQAPHDEDEVYLVISGRARVRVAGEEQTLGRGSLLFVPASAEHSFCEIEEDLTLLVFFATGGPGA